MSRREQNEHRWNAWLLRPALIKTRWWGAVTERDSDWIRQFFSMASPRLEVTGSLKFDGIVRDSSSPQTHFYRNRFGFHDQEKIIVAGSTHAPEETWLVGLVKKLELEFPELRLILVPRSTSRCDELEEQIRQHDVQFLRASRVTGPCQMSQRVTLVDSIGALRDIWGLADIAFVGGSFAGHGGQNMVEPASYGKPVCFGPHVWNFQTVVDELLAANAAVQVQTIEDLEKTLRRWLTNPCEAENLGLRARDVVQKYSDALDRTVSGILSVLPTCAVRMKEVS